MRVKLQTAVSFAVAVSVWCATGCSKAKAPARPDPHSVDGVMLRLHEQGKMLNDAFVRKDFGYIHDYAYYFTSLTQALFSKLDDEQRKSLRRQFDELVTLSQQLDRAAGGRHEQATEATLQKLQAALGDIDKQLRGARAGG